MCSFFLMCFDKKKKKKKQRESTAAIKAAPAAYVYTSPPKGQNIIEFDCRGLEFVNFKADVTWPLPSPSQFSPPSPPPLPSESIYFIPIDGERIFFKKQVTYLMHS